MAGTSCRRGAGGGIGPERALDIPLVAIEAPPREFGTLLRRHWDAGDAVLPLPYSARDDDRTRRASDSLVARLRPALVVRAASPVGTPSRTEPTGTDTPIARVPEGTALVVATAGSTGAAKGVVLSHAALAASTSASLARLEPESQARFALALPTHHIAGVQVLLRAWARATEPIVVDSGDALPPYAGGHGQVSLVPTQLRRLVERDPSRLRGWTVLVGGGPVDGALIERAQTTAERIVTSYGMSETAGGCVYDGIPLDGVEVEIGGDGRIRVRGPMLFDGYLHHLQGTDGPALDRAVRSDGWFVTGDVGRFVDGRLEVGGRADDVIVSGGENVPAGAVAHSLRRHPAVADAAVVGTPDDTWGCMVVAVVVARGTPPVLRDLREHVARSFPRTHAPHRLVVVERLPIDAMGKLDRVALAVLAAGAGEDYRPA